MKRVAWVLALLVCSLATRADLLIMEVVPLKHRLAADLLPTLRPLLSEGGSVNGLDQQLVFHTTPANLVELKHVLADLDTRQRQLRITVRQNVQDASQQAADQLAARLRIGNGEVAAGTRSPGDAAGAAISIAGAQTGASIESYRTNDQEDLATTHFVSAIEGTPAYIATGQAVPLPQTSAVVTPYGANVQQSLDYRNVGSGVYVTPRLVGDEVTLEISPYNAQLDRRGGGMIAERQVDTVVRGRLGAWLALGGTTSASHDHTGSELSSTTNAQAAAYEVWVKVDVSPKRIPTLDTTALGR